MKNYGYFLDSSRFVHYQRNLIRKLHQDMEKSGILLNNMAKTIEKHQQYLKLIPTNIFMAKFFNVCSLKNFFQTNLPNQYHYIHEGLKVLKPNKNYDINDFMAIKDNLSWTYGGCYFLKHKDNLWITYQPPKSSNLKNVMVIKPQDSVLFGHQWFFNGTTDELFIKYNNNHWLWEDGILKHPFSWPKKFINMAQKSLFYIQSSSVIYHHCQIIPKEKNLNFIYKPMDFQKFFIKII
jgi:hypothetical protein